MTFASTSFLLIFLPISLLLYYLMPMKWKNIVLFMMNAVFYLMNDNQHAFFLFVLIMISYCLLKMAKRQRMNAVVGICLLLFILFYFKYYGKILDIFPLQDINEIYMPLGISFICFSILSVFFDIARNRIEEIHFFTYFNYVLFFPKIFMGPLMRYEPFQKEWENRKIEKDEVETGTCLFVKGCFYKVVFANTFGMIFQMVNGNDTALGAWLMMLAYTLQLYFDFYGYTCMAMGLGNMLGFHLPQNFNHPYIATSIQDFWRRWHISLSTWFKDYIYIPLGGSRKGNKNTIRNILIVWICTGMWHGSTLSYIMWGLYYGILLIVERFILKDILNKIPNGIKRCITFILVMFGWIFFFEPDLGSVGTFFVSLFGKNGFMDVNALALVSQYFIWFILGGLFCTGLPSYIYNKIQIKMNNVYPYIKGLMIVCAWIFIFMYLIADSYQAFLYFQF